MYLSLLVLVYVQCSSFSWDVSSPRIFSFYLFQSLFRVYSLLLYHFVSFETSPFPTAHFTANTFKILLGRLAYSIPTSFLHPYSRWCTISLWSPHNLDFSHSTSLLIFFHALASIICSFNANIYWWCFSGISITFEPVRVFFTILLCRFYLKLLLCQNLSILFCPSFRIFFSFSSFFTCSLTFFANNYFSLIK